MPRFAITAEMDWNPTANLEILEIIEADDREKAWAAFLGGWDPDLWPNVIDRSLLVYEIGEPMLEKLPVDRD